MNQNIINILEQNIKNKTWHNEDGHSQPVAEMTYIEIVEALEYLDSMENIHARLGNTDTNILTLFKENRKLLMQYKANIFESKIKVIKLANTENVVGVIGDNATEKEIEEMIKNNEEYYGSSCYVDVLPKEE
jgi:hypothetical protein